MIKPLTFSLALLYLLVYPRSWKLMAAPNVLRVGTPENIFVECQDCTDDNDIRVEIIAITYPTKSKRLASTSVTLTRAKSFQDFGQIKIPAGDFSKDPNINQYVYLQAKFPDAELEKLVLVSFQSGYIYIQTDKTLYTPNSKGSDMVEAELRNIQIVTSPYTIHFKRTPKYFKPGMSFDVAIEVVNPDGTPGQNVDVVVDPGVDTAEVALGDNMKINLILNRQESTEKNITYLILSKGQLVKYGSCRVKSQVLLSKMVTITKHMLPSFRIVAYFHTNDNEVVADSVWVDAKDSCMGSLKLESASARASSSYEPRKMFPLKVTGDPGATVGLVAVDKGVYVLNNKYRLNQKKVWDMVETYDTGCTPGGGQDGISVFYDAGLLFESNTASGTPLRQELRCPAPSRRKRSTAKVTSSLGICVAKPLEVIVKKDFFIELRLPYAAVRGEQLEVKAILYNYSPGPATVLVDLIEEIHVCSAASKHGKYQQQVKVGAKTTQSVPFVIIPTREGQYRIEVKAAIKGDSLATDGVMKMLRVVKPSGCGEENMIHMTRTVVATMYLDKTNQWEPVNTDRRNEALQHITTGYLNELNYRKSDGSFAVYPDQQSSTWLTAYVAKVFAMANNLVAVATNVICDAVRFLILNAQEPAGTFREVGKVYHEDMIGDVLGTDSDASMTAFCLIAMQESRPLCAATVSSLSSSINKAVAYLEKRLPSLTNPYAVAVTSYALANENKLNREILYRFASPALSYWQVPKGRVYTLEATAYALLALVKAEATLMVYQAVADYWSSDKGPEYDLNVDILLPGRSKPDKFNFNNENQHATRTSKVKDINKDVKVIATGKGKATLTLAKGRARTISKYNMNTADSERGSLIIYLDKVSHTRPEEITFRVHQKLKVGVLQPAPVSVYEHNYQQNNQNCSMQKKGNISNDERTAMVCETTLTIKIDFVYKVRVQGFTDSLSTDFYTAQVLEVIKEGSNDVGPMGKLCTFLSYQHCRHALDLRQGHTYLIMGASKDIYRDDRSQTYRYVLGERTWIEYWPTEAECKTTKYEPTCVGMEKMVQQYRTHGCQQ
ncbi:Complement C3 Complement C3 beta chain Complement C3 alpha chain [Larimichthys crocea]|uniref:Complement C3 Complement C3 beta chain Complement C3 alpha chain n=1 Tax=Larimichthys crocea TaxID=215358 RepID=A0A6G0JB38_LARCR|nr:Complement C3 Complement C3 beta chain Complement C3 alpha chain [Larimichthys crocea]